MHLPRNVIIRLRGDTSRTSLDERFTIFRLYNCKILCTLQRKAASWLAMEPTLLPNTPNRALKQYLSIFLPLS